MLAGVVAASYLGLWQKETPIEPSASPAGVIQLPLPEFAASETMPPGPAEKEEYSQPDMAVAMPPSRQLYVQVKALNLRQGPGVDHLVITQLNQGQKLTEVERRPDWVKVRIGGTDMVGWVYSTYVDPEPR